MKVHVNENLCSGSGLCVDTCPAVFQLKENGISIANVEQVPTEFQQGCRKAADNCPSGAISIEE